MRFELALLLLVGIAHMTGCFVSGADVQLLIFSMNLRTLWTSRLFCPFLLAMRDLANIIEILNGDNYIQGCI